MVKIPRGHITGMDAFDTQLSLTMAGVEWESEWIIPSVPAGAKVHALVTVSPSKYLILNSRQIQMDQERGFYRFYTGFNSAVPAVSLVGVPMRGDTTIPVQTTFQTLSSVNITGPALIEIPIFGSAGGGPVSVSGNINNDTSVRVVPPGTQLVLEFENASVAASYWRQQVKFWEVKAESMNEIQEV